MNKVYSPKNKNKTIFKPDTKEFKDTDNASDTSTNSTIFDKQLKDAAIKLSQDLNKPVSNQVSNLIQLIAIYMMALNRIEWDEDKQASYLDFKKLTIPAWTNNGVFKAPKQYSQEKFDEFINSENRKRHIHGRSLDFQSYMSNCEDQIHADDFPCDLSDTINIVAAFTKGMIPDLKSDLINFLYLLSDLQKTFQTDSNYIPENNEEFWFRDIDDQDDIPFKHLEKFINEVSDEELTSIFTMSPCDFDNSKPNFTSISVINGSELKKLTNVEKQAFYERSYSEDSVNFNLDESVNEDILFAVVACNKKPYGTSGTENPNLDTMLYNYGMTLLTFASLNYSPYLIQDNDKRTLSMTGHLSNTITSTNTNARSSTVFIVSSTNDDPVIKIKHELIQFAFIFFNNHWLKSRNDHDQNSTRYAASDPSSWQILSRLPDLSPIKGANMVPVVDMIMGHRGVRDGSVSYVEIKNSERVCAPVINARDFKTSYLGIANQILSTKLANIKNLDLKLKQDQEHVSIDVFATGSRYILDSLIMTSIYKLCLRKKQEFNASSDLFEENLKMMEIVNGSLRGPIGMKRSNPNPSLVRKNTTYASSASTASTSAAPVLTTPSKKVLEPTVVSKKKFFGKKPSKEVKDGSDPKNVYAANLWKLIGDTETNIKSVSDIISSGLETSENTLDLYKLKAKLEIVKKLESNIQNGQKLDSYEINTSDDVIKECLTNWLNDSKVPDCDLAIVTDYCIDSETKTDDAKDTTVIFNPSDDELLTTLLSGYDADHCSSVKDKLLENFTISGDDFINKLNESEEDSVTYLKSIGFAAGLSKSLISYIKDIK